MLAGCFELELIVEVIRLLTLRLTLNSESGKIVRARFFKIESQKSFGISTVRRQ
jgi:hypothetical protein